MNGNALIDSLALNVAQALTAYGAEYKNTVMTWGGLAGIVYITNLMVKGDPDSNFLAYWYAVGSVVGLGYGLLDKNGWTAQQTTGCALVAGGLYILKSTV